MSGEEVASTLQDSPQTAGLELLVMSDQLQCPVAVQSVTSPFNQPLKIRIPKAANKAGQKLPDRIL